MSYRIEQVDTRVASEETLRAMHEYYVAMEAEDLPDDPPTPYESYANNWRYLPEEESIPRWLVWEGDELAAVAVAWMNLTQNLENGHARIHVKPERRGHGLARRLATPVLDALEEGGRKRLSTSMTEGVAWEALAERAGMKKAYREKRSRMVVSEIDWDMMDSWIDRASERASDYELYFWQSPLADELVPKFCDLHFVMNTAPREEFEMEDEALTPARWRDTEAKEALKQNDLHCYVAIHKPTGDWVGYTMIETQRLHPEQAWQWDTGVHPDHRNKGLGRWVKAAMLKRVAQEQPEVQRVDTWNAGSNEPMLNINVAMGFKPILLTGTWQGDLATARKRLGV